MKDITENRLEANDELTDFDNIANDHRNSSERDQIIEIVEKLILHLSTLKKFKHLKPPKNLGANNSIAASQIQNIETSCVHWDKGTKIFVTNKIFFHLTTIYTPVDKL